MSEPAKTAPAKTAEPNLPPDLARLKGLLKHGVSEIPQDDVIVGGDKEIDERSPLLDVFYFCLDDKYELDGAYAWLNAHAPGVPRAHLLTTLPLDKLSRDSVVFVLARKGTARHPVKPIQPITGRNREGFLVHETRTGDQIAEEFGAYGPVLAGKYWSTRTSRFSGGLNFDGFLDELGQLIAPYGIGWRDASEKADGPRGKSVYIKPT
jgi:hypothetical protein